MDAPKTKDDFIKAFQRLRDTGNYELNPLYYELIKHHEKFNNWIIVGSSLILGILIANIKNIEELLPRINLVLIFIMLSAVITSGIFLKLHLFFVQTKFIISMTTIKSCVKGLKNLLSNEIKICEIMNEEEISKSFDKLLKHTDDVYQTVFKTNEIMVKDYKKHFKIYSTFLILQGSCFAVIPGHMIGTWVDLDKVSEFFTYIQNIFV